MRKLLCSIVFSLVLLMPSFVLAASVSPSASDLTVTPGEKSTATISVRNDAEWSKNYEISFAQAVFGKEAADISFTALSATLKGAVSATPTLFTLAAQESRNIDVNIRLPAGTAAQSPTIAIFVTEKADQGSVGSVQASVASLLFLHVPGHLTRSMAIDSFVAVPSFTFGASTTISGLFRNDGEETVILPNELRVFGPFGKEIGRGQLSSDPKHLPAGTTRGVSLSWPAKVGFSRFILGSYRFELWDGDQKLAQTSATFLPTSFLIPAGIGFALLLLGIIISVRRRT